MKKIAHNKLIRDNIPAIIQAAGKTCSIKTLDEQQYIAELKAKLIEESLEVQHAENQAQVISELADVYEVLEALQTALKIDSTEIQRKQMEKANINGKFSKKLFLEYVREDKM